MTTGYHHRRAADEVNVKRIASAFAAVLILGVESTQAEQEEPKSSATPQPQPKLVIRANELFPLNRSTRLGMFTLALPRRDGEIVRLTIPVGELVSRTARAVSDANHRRAERKADERVRKDLEQFLATTAKRATEP